MAFRTSYKLFVESGKHFHPAKYSYPPNQEYKNCETLLQVFCKKHEKYFTTSYARHILSKKGCKKCGDERGSAIRKCGYEKFMSKGKEIHGDQFTYPKIQVYKNSVTPLKIKCNYCNTIIITNYSSHIHSEGGCMKCSHKNRGIRSRHTYESFVENAFAIHGDKFIYPPEQEYLNARTPLKVFCKTHKEYFLTSYFQHITYKHGCFICANREKASKRIHGYDLFVSKAKEIHGYKYEYFPDQVYGNQSTKFPVFCKKHDKIFYTNYSLHVYEKCGCPDCGRNRSKGEIFIKDFLNKYNIEFVEQYRPEGLKHERNLSIDFYLPDVKLLIEFQGEQHFRPAKRFGGVNSLIPQLKRDQIKRKFAYDNNYELIAIEKYQLKDLHILFGKYFPGKNF